ncbi:hypothetical protein PR002_g20668 [Phytophthora rubi]|uniref:RxLR effector protein n=1 Tax=Phytophthora rubi TaxID=129364 RepID=A0A6A3JCX8_9STRA|nr:hypothetical protein PR002_g20668 [Phytophthora rubi]
MSPAPGWLASSWIVVGCLISITDATARREHCYPLWKSLTKKLGFAPSGQRVQDLLVRHKSRYSSVFVGTCLERLQVAYDPEIRTYAKVKADAIKLYDAGEGRWGTDETTFIRILFSSPREHLVLVNDIYKKNCTGERIRTDTDANYGDLLVTLLHIPTDGDGGDKNAPEAAF